MNYTILANFEENTAKFLKCSALNKYKEVFINKYWEMNKDNPEDFPEIQGKYSLKYKNGEVVEIATDIKDYLSLKVSNPKSIICYTKKYPKFKHGQFVYINTLPVYAKHFSQNCFGRIKKSNHRIYDYEDEIEYGIYSLEENGDWDLSYWFDEEFLTLVTDNDIINRLQDSYISYLKRIGEYVDSKLA